MFQQIEYFFAELERRRREARAALLQRVQQEIEGLLPILPDMLNEDCPIIRRGLRQIELMPLGTGPRSRIDDDESNASDYMYCDSHLYLGTDGQVYNYGLPRCAQVGSKLDYHRVDLTDDAAPLLVILERLHMVYL